MTGTSFIAPSTDGFGNTISYANNAVSYDAPIVSGLEALHVFGITLTQSLNNLAPISASPPDASILGTGPTINVTPPYAVTNGLNTLKLGVADSSFMTVIQAVYIPTTPTNGSAPTYVTLWSTALGTSGFSLQFNSTGVSFISYNASGNQVTSTLTTVPQQWNLIVSQVDSTNASAPVFTVTNVTGGGTVSTHTGTTSVTPSGSPIYCGLTPNSTINYIAPMWLSLMVVHNTVLTSAQIATSVAAFRTTLSARGITC